jgi:hypothetical protein
VPLTITVRALGRRTPIEPDWSVPWPPTPSGDGEGITLRELITRVVLDEVAAFQRRQRERRLDRVMLPASISRDLDRGKAEPAGHPPQEADAPAAVGNALQAFEDGIYLVVIDGVEQRELDRQVFVRDDSQVTFLRLVMLAGA